MLLHDEDYDASLLLLRSSSRGNNIIRGNISVWSRSFCSTACYMIEEFGESEMSGHARDNHLSPHSRAIVFENWGVAAHESERQIATCSRDYEERGMVIIIIIVIFCVLQCRVVIPALNASSSRQQHCAVLSWWKTAATHSFLHMYTHCHHHRSFWMLFNSFELYFWQSRKLPLRVKLYNFKGNFPMWGAQF